MQLFYTPDIVPPTHTLDEQESRHAVRVLRLGVGDTIWLTDGRGTIYRAVVAEADQRRCRVDVVEAMERWGKRSYGLTMAVAPTKNTDRFEWFLEKATEVGCDAFIPLLTEHSERRTIKHERCGKVITSAMKQSLKAYHPELMPVTGVKELVERPFDGVRLIAHCREDGARKLMREVVAKGDNVLVMIGPEGDFSPGEIELALAAGFTAITLGERRLRTETAALAAVMNTAFIND